MKKKYVSVEDVMSFINTFNRGSADYFIVDQIEDLCKSKAKTLEELNCDKRVQNELNNPSNIIASFGYEHNDGDQIWSDCTNYYCLSDGTFRKTFENGYYGETSEAVVEYEEIVSEMDRVEKEVQQKKEAIKKHGGVSAFTRGGYIIYRSLKKIAIEKASCSKVE